MIAKDYINYMIPSLKPTDLAEKAHTWMQEMHLRELPVVENNHFLGILTEEILIESEIKKLTVADFQLKGTSQKLNLNEHFYDLLKNSFKEGLTTIAIVDNENVYQGVVSIQDVVLAFSNMSSINNPGAIIVLSTPMINYSLAEISRIVETESGKILSSFLETHSENKADIKLTIKLNIENASNIVSSLERFGYRVTSVFGAPDNSEKDQERLDSLMNYLQI